MRENALRIARLKAGLSQVELAERSGTTQATISRLERGQFARPSWPIAQVVSQALGMDPRDLFGDHSLNNGSTEQVPA